jgi:hypothetical protein
MNEKGPSGQNVLIQQLLSKKKKGSTLANFPSHTIISGQELCSSFLRAEAR